MKIKKIDVILSIVHIIISIYILFFQSIISVDIIFYFFIISLGIPSIVFCICSIFHSENDSGYFSHLKKLLFFITTTNSILFFIWLEDERAEGILVFIILSFAMYIASVIHCAFSLIMYNILTEIKR